MADEKQPVEPGTEYRVSDEPEFTGEYTAGPVEGEPRPGLLSRLKNRRVVIPIALIVVAWVVYQFVGQRQRLAAEAQPPPAPVVAAVPTAEEVGMGALRRQVATLEERSQRDQTQLSQLQSSLGETQAALQVLDRGLTSVNVTLQGLSAGVRQLVERQRQAAMPAKKVEEPPPVYFVQAIVPGRAWLRSDKGKTLTVKVGDALAGYGTVLMVDPARGTVGTSSGAVIGYGAEDS